MSISTSARADGWPLGELPWADRWRVQRRVEDAGRWPTLEWLSATRASDAWGRFFDHGVLLRALETTGQLIDGATAADSLRAAIDDLYNQVLRELDRTSDYDRISAISAGSAAIRAGAEALGEQSLGRGIPDEETDPESWTSAFHASIAISGGAIWDHAGDPDRRRAFWQWWLREAHRLLGDGD